MLEIYKENMLKVYKDRNISLRPVEKKYQSYLNGNYYSIYCLKNNCSNPSVSGFSKCALHCPEDKVESNKISEYFESFIKLFINNIRDQITTKVWESESKESIAKFYDFFEVGLIERISEPVIDTIQSIDLIFEEIYFPSNIIHGSFEFQVLKYINSIKYINCTFNTKYLIAQRSYFIECDFLKDVNLYPFLGVENSEIYHYIKCNFQSKVCFQPSIFLGEVNYNVFKNCFFESELIVDSLNFKKNLFYFPDFNNEEDVEILQDYFNDMKNFYSLNILLIKKCIFDLDFKLNGFDDFYLDKINLYGINFNIDDLIIKSLKVIDTKFESKLEIKNRVVRDFLFKNSNVEKLFDSFESKFEKSYFYKSIFNSFAGFEKVVFGIKDKDTDEYQAKFVYTTFMSFSNFRRTKFLSGLDFENSNLKEQPNFLKTYISSNNTNRESFRIIKHSFDTSGNKLEANKFFVKEMQAYKKEVNQVKYNGAEIDEEQESSKNAALIFYLNNYISEFGENYVKPIKILLVSAIIYTLINMYNKWYFESHEYFMSWQWFDVISKFLNELAVNILPFRLFIKDRNGIEFISLFFYIWFAVLIWQTIVAVKRHTQR